MAAVTVTPFFNTHTRARALDPYQRSGAAPHLVRKPPQASTSRSKSPIVFETPSPLPRETRSLDLDPRQRLPIGPQPSGSGSRSPTPTPSILATSTPSSAKSPLGSIRSRETRALRRQGSIFNVPISLNPAANVSSSSLASTHSLPATSSEEIMHSQQSTMNGTREMKNSTSPARYRKANVPAPLNLNNAPSTRLSRRSISRPPTPGPGSGPTPPIKSKPDLQHPPLPALPQRAHVRRRSRSATFLLSPSQSNSGSPFPTPLTPSFRFHVAEIPEHREKRLNKLAKTLGENIPASLVFPLSASTAGSSHTDLSSSPVTPALERRDSLDASYTGRAKSDKNRRTSKMLQALDLNSFPPSQKKNPKGTSNWTPPTEWSLGPSETTDRLHGDTGNGYDEEKEDDVLGVWNAESYDTVLDRLRNLKR
ncbi:hypothetical protein A7U60_g1065 [Sanghuangporus baumii]|uniref:Uncharacterized protein n=1 Tax=Sanghuangporus baumii TaxID=108892 RepID=A0A9Q5NBJ4_SANBA|nr:hypothetical protein A7U60_g1065 [Sanghuangporus baumii]